MFFSLTYPQGYPIPCCVVEGLLHYYLVLSLAIVLFQQARHTPITIRLLPLQNMLQSPQPLHFVTYNNESQVERNSTQRDILNYDTAVDGSQSFHPVIFSPRKLRCILITAHWGIISQKALDSCEKLVAVVLRGGRGGSHVVSDECVKKVDY